MRSLLLTRIFASRRRGRAVSSDFDRRENVAIERANGPVIAIIARSLRSALSTGWALCAGSDCQLGSVDFEPWPYESATQPTDPTQKTDSRQPLESLLGASSGHE